MRTKNSTVPRERKKMIDPQSAISILKDFYHEAKKEFKKHEKIQASIAGSDQEGAGSLHFICDGFDLKLIIKEGGAQ